MDLKKLDYITAPEEWIEDILEKSSKTSPSKAFWRKYGSIAAMIGFFLLCSTSVTVAAMKSTAFQTWLENIFGSGNVKEVVLTTPTALPTADVKARDNTVPLQENTMVAGEKESFVCEYHFVGDEEQIDQVYTVVSDGLKKMTPSTFEGEYNGTKFGSNMSLAEMKYSLLIIPVACQKCFFTMIRIQYMGQERMEIKKNIC